MQNRNQNYNQNHNQNHNQHHGHAPAPQSFMQLDEQAATEAGLGGGMQDGGAYEGTLKTKMYTANSGALGVEFSLETQQGDANYLSLIYQKKTGDINPIGNNLIQAIMFCCGVSNTSVAQNPIANDDGSFDYYIPELEGKHVGLVLQKTLYSKDNGDDGYKFDIIQAFKAGSRQTALELSNREQPQHVDKLVANLIVKDTRTNQGVKSEYARGIDNATSNRPSSKFDQLPKNNGANNHDIDLDDLPY